MLPEQWQRPVAVDPQNGGRTQLMSKILSPTTTSKYGPHYWVTNNIPTMNTIIPANLTWHYYYSDYCCLNYRLTAVSSNHSWAATRFGFVCLRVEIHIKSTHDCRTTGNLHDNQPTRSLDVVGKPFFGGWCVPLICQSDTMAWTAIRGRTSMSLQGQIDAFRWLTKKITGIR